MRRTRRIFDHHPSFTGRLLRFGLGGVLGLALAVLIIITVRTALAPTVTYDPDAVPAPPPALVAA